MAINPVDNVGKKNLPAFPYDQSNRRPGVLELAIVSAGEVIGYLPAAAIDNGDGTATLSVGASFSLAPGDFEIGAVEIKNSTTDDRVTVDPTGSLKIQEARVSTGTVGAVDVDDTDSPATLVLAANAARKEYTVVHEDPSATIYIGFDDTVTTLTGIPVVGNQMYGSNKYTGDIYAVASVPGPISVRVAEVA